MDRHLRFVVPLTSHDCVVVVGQALQPAFPSSHCLAHLDERLSDPSCLSAEPLAEQTTTSIYRRWQTFVYDWL